MSERESTCNRGKVHIAGEAHARQGKCKHAREKKSTHIGAGKHTCGERKHNGKKALERRQKTGKVHEMGCTNERDSVGE